MGPDNRGIAVSCQINGQTGHVPAIPAVLIQCKSGLVRAGARCKAETGLRAVEGRLGLTPRELSQTAAVSVGRYAATVLREDVRSGAACPCAAVPEGVKDFSPNPATANL